MVLVGGESGAKSHVRGLFCRVYLAPAQSPDLSSSPSEPLSVSLQSSQNHWQGCLCPRGMSCLSSPGPQRGTVSRAAHWVTQTSLTTPHLTALKMSCGPRDSLPPKSWPKGRDPGACLSRHLSDTVAGLRQLHLMVEWEAA